MCQGHSYTYTYSYIQGQGHSYTYTYSYIHGSNRRQPTLPGGQAALFAPWDVVTQGLDLGFILPLAGLAFNPSLRFAHIR